MTRTPRELPLKSDAPATLACQVCATCSAHRACGAMAGPGPLPGLAFIAFSCIGGGEQYVGITEVTDVRLGTASRCFFLFGAYCFVYPTGRVLLVRAGAID